MLHRARIACVALLTFALASGCAKNAGPPITRIALVADAGGFADRSFNAAASAGLSACAAHTGVEIERVATASPADYESKLAVLATRNFDMVIGVGASMALDLEHVARRFEGTRFAILDAVVRQPNVDSITFKEQDGSFLAGALAALVTRTKHVAFLGGADVGRLRAAEAGFSAGAREVNSAVTVRDSFVGSFEDVARAKSAARALFAGGSDVVYVVAGRGGLGALAAAGESGAGYAIGVDADQDGVVPGKILTSVVKRVDRAALRVCLEALGQKPVSGHLEMGLGDGGIELSNFRYTRRIVGSSNLQRLERLRNAIAAGTLVVPATQSELARFKPVPLRASTPRRERSAAAAR